MIISNFVLAIATCQSQDFHIWRDLAIMGTKLTYRSEWKTASAEIDKKISFLKSDSTQSRKAKLNHLCRSFRTSHETAENGILALRLSKTFRIELKELGYQFLIQTVYVNSAGIADWNFMKEMYMSQYPDGQNTDCGGLGLRLVREFPRDLELQRAFLADCGQGYAPLKDRYEALKMLPSWEHKLSDWEYHDRYANITYTITKISKKPDYVAVSKREIREAMKYAPTEAKRKFKQMMLDILNKLYPNIGSL